MAQARTVLVTGGAKRVGRQIVQSLHGAGYNVAIHCRHAVQEAESLRAALNGVRHGSAMVITADLGDIERLPWVVDQVLGQFGRLDALINNASTYFATPIGQASVADWGMLFNANAKGPFFLAQAAAESLRASGGCIVNIVDIYAQRPQKHHAIYVMAKAALAAMTRALAVDLAPHVRVNAIAPGAVLWPDTPSVHEDQAELISRTPLQRAGTPAEVAEAVRWLIEGAAFMTGQELRLDGGRSLPV